MLEETEKGKTFSLQLLKLKPIIGLRNACWHPLFQTWALAAGFPILSRNGESGVELSFSVMIQLAEVLGAISYNGGVVLKGHSSILFPTNTSPPQDLESLTGQWHLIHVKDKHFVNFSMLDGVENRLHCQFEDIEYLSQKRTFLGCYKSVTIHLGTSDAVYTSDSNHSATDPAQPPPELSGFSLNVAIMKIIGESAGGNITLPKAARHERDFGPYDQALIHCRKLPVILYDTSDRRAWMVPAISIIFHMIHTFCLRNQGDLKDLAQSSYATAVADIGGEIFNVLSQNTDFPLYNMLSSNNYYTLKEQVTRHILQLQKMIRESESRFS